MTVEQAGCGSVAGTTGAWYAEKLGLEPAVEREKSRRGMAR